MTEGGSLGNVTTRVVISHAVGLCLAGITDTMGTTAGVSLGGAGFGLCFGGLLSAPWIGALGLLIWFKGLAIDAHPIAFAALGPVLVVGSYVLLLGSGGFEREVATSSISSSIVYLALVFANRFLADRRRARSRPSR